MQSIKLAVNPPVIHKTNAEAAFLTGIDLEASYPGPQSQIEKIVLSPPPHPAFVTLAL